MNGTKRLNRPSNTVNKSRTVKTKVADKQVPIEGVHTNSVLTHVITSLIGSVVEVQVNNGKIYEGILRTFSPKMEVVLSAAHQLEESGGRSDTFPSRERLVENIIFNIDTIVHMSAINVDLGYADAGDGFTDAAISRYNGHGAEKEKYLEPWQCDGDVPGPDMQLNEEGSRGWDPTDMFKRNKENFNVESVYDDGLDAYTTRLEKKDTAEWHEKELKAQKIAEEIESCEVSQQRYDLENENDVDEETKFSAVVRPEKHHSAPSPLGMTPANSTGRYVAPHQRGTGPSPAKVPSYRAALLEQQDTAKPNGRAEDKKQPVEVVDSKQTRASNSSDSVNHMPSAAKLDSKTQTSPGNDKETEKQKLKRFSQDFKLADKKAQQKWQAGTPGSDDKEIKAVSAAPVTAAPVAAAPVAAAPVAAAPVAAAPVAAAPVAAAPVAAAPVAAVPTAVAVDSTAEPEIVQLQNDAPEPSDKEDKEPKVARSLNPNAPVFQPRQQLSTSPQPSGPITSSASGSQHGKVAKKVTVSVAKNHHQQHHQQPQMQMADQSFTAAHVQAATGQPIITANQYQPAQSFVNPYAYPSPFPMNQMMHMQQGIRANQDMQQAQQQYAYAVPPGMMPVHMGYNNQSAQLLQNGTVHVPPLPQQTPPPAHAPPGPGSMAAQQVMQHPTGVPPQQQQAAMAQGVSQQQPPPPQYGGYQGQPGTLGHPPVQLSPQNPATSPLATPTVGPMAYGSQYYYHHHPPFANGGQPSHGSMQPHGHQQMGPNVVWYPLGQQQHHMQQHLNAYPQMTMSGMLMGPPPQSVPGAGYMQQQPMPGGHHPMPNYSQQQQQP